MDRSPHRSSMRTAALPTTRMTRRDALKAAALAGLSLQLPTAARALVEPPTLRLDNGLRVHLAPNKSGYVSAALVLRAKDIAEPRGLAHIMEHTSFTGAAGRISLAVRPEGGHYTRITVETDKTCQGEVEKLAKAFFTPVHTKVHADHVVRGAH